MICRCDDLMVDHPVIYAYAPDVLEALGRHGLRPAGHTPPETVREALSELYRYEIRQLRARLLQGRVRRQDYKDHVIALRRRYWLLSVPVQLWARSSA